MSKTSIGMSLCRYDGSSFTDMAKLVVLSIAV